MESLTIQEMQSAYPNEWVLVGNPELSGTKIVRGFVVAHNVDKRAIAYSGIDWRAHFQSAMTVFTGEQ